MATRASSPRKESTDRIARAFFEDPQESHVAIAFHHRDAISADHVLATVVDRPSHYADQASPSDLVRALKRRPGPEVQAERGHADNGTPDTRRN